MELEEGVREPPYTWEHFLSVDQGDLAATIKREFWVSLYAGLLHVF